MDASDRVLKCKQCSELIKSQLYSENDAEQKSLYIIALSCFAVIMENKYGYENVARVFYNIADEYACKSMNIDPEI